MNTSKVLRAYVFTTTPQTVTGSEIRLGSLSTVTGGVITDKDAVKGISVIYAYGASRNDPDTKVIISDTSDVRIYPASSQDNFRARISILY